MVLGDSYVNCRLEDGSELGSCRGDRCLVAHFGRIGVKRGYKHVTDKSRETKLQ